MKFSGEVGFWLGEIETSPGIWQSSIEERHYTGDVLKNTRSFQAASEQLNDDFKVNNRISILSDIYMRRNWTSIRYVIWNGTKFRVTSVDVTYPRLTLEIGGVYNGEDAAFPPVQAGTNSGC